MPQHTPDHPSPTTKLIQQLSAVGPSAQQVFDGLPRRQQRQIQAHLTLHPSRHNLTLQFPDGSSSSQALILAPEPHRLSESGPPQSYPSSSLIPPPDTPLLTSAPLP
jgi:hypothetical protein